MAVHKELCVAIRKYKNAQGEERTEWLNIGRIIEKNDGGKFMVLKPYVNLAAIPRQGDDVLVSMFDPKQDGEGRPSQSGGNRAMPPQSQQSRSEPEEDDIPF